MAKPRSYTDAQPDLGMPLANARHERFAQFVVSGMAQGPAYLEAGFRGSESASRANAARLIATDSVASRVAQLRAPALAAVQAEAAEAVASAEYIVRKSVAMADYGSELVATRTMFGEVIKDEDGHPVMRMRDWRAADAGLSRLAKMYPATFAPDAAGAGDEAAKHLHLHFENLTVEELRAIASGR